MNTKNEDRLQSLKPYDDGFFASYPTGFTKFLRTFIPYQFVRFVVINLKMLRMISKSHK